jgi:hypothetical protein
LKRIRRLNLHVLSKILLQQIIKCSHFVGWEDLCNERPEVEDTSEVNEVTVCVPKTDDGRVVLFRGPIMACVL